MTEESVEDPALLELFKECENDHVYQNLYEKLKVALNKDPYNVEIVWRFARSCYYCSLENTSKTEDLINEGNNYQNIFSI
jgi:hypothetical protein